MKNPTLVAIQKFAVSMLEQTYGSCEVLGEDDFVCLNAGNDEIDIQLTISELEINHL